MKYWEEPSDETSAMKIAIIGWGSLVWNPSDLPCREKADAWQKDGPPLKIEFSRVSKDSRLTLVIDPLHGLEVPTLYATSTRTRLEDAVADLRQREETVWRHIAYASANANSAHDRAIREVVFRWLKSTDYEAAVWTAIPSNYQEQLGVEFSVEHATTYLTNLPKIVKARAFDYILKAPKQIETELRKYLRRESILR